MNDIISLMSDSDSDSDSDDDVVQFVKIVTPPLPERRRLTRHPPNALDRDQDEIHVVPGTPSPSVATKMESPVCMLAREYKIERPLALVVLKMNEGDRTASSALLTFLNSGSTRATAAARTGNVEALRSKLRICLDLSERNPGPMALQFWKLGNLSHRICDTDWSKMSSTAPETRLPVARRLQLTVARLPNARAPNARLPNARLPMSRLSVQAWLPETRPNRNILPRPFTVTPRVPRPITCRRRSQCDLPIDFLSPHSTFFTREMDEAIVGAAKSRGRNWCYLSSVVQDAAFQDCPVQVTKDQIAWRYKNIKKFNRRNIA
jgi:hypothetical protein